MFQKALEKNRRLNRLKRNKMARELSNRRFRQRIRHKHYKQIKQKEIEKSYDSYLN